VWFILWYSIDMRLQVNLPRVIASTILVMFLFVYSSALMSLAAVRCVTVLYSFLFIVGKCSRN